MARAWGRIFQPVAQSCVGEAGRRAEMLIRVLGLRCWAVLGSGDGAWAVSLRAVPVQLAEVVRGASEQPFVFARGEAAPGHHGEFLAGLELPEHWFHSAGPQLVVIPAAGMAQPPGRTRPDPRWPPRPARRTPDRLQAATHACPPAAAAADHAVETGNSAAHRKIPSTGLTQPKARRLCDRLIYTGHALPRTLAHAALSVPSHGLPGVATLERGLREGWRR
jgi:hypothetical protein